MIPIFSLSIFSWDNNLLSLILRIFIPSIFIFTVFINFKKINKYLLIAISVFIILSLFSLAENINLLRSFHKTYEIILCLIFSYFIVKKNYYNPYDIFLKYVFSITFFSILFNMFTGGLNIVEISGRFPSVNANSIGSIFGVLFLYYLFFKKEFYISTVCLIFVLLSGSLSAIFSIIISILLYNILRLKLLRILLPNYISLSLVYCGILFIIISNYNYLIINEISLSGRVKWWTVLIENINQFDGVGLGNVKYIMGDLFGKEVTSHNFFIDYLLTFGYVPVILFLYLIFIFYFKKSILCIEEHPFNTLLFLFLVIKAFTSSTLGYYSFETSILLISIFHMINLDRIKKNALQK